MFKHKKHLFFDLDHTLWDFETNAKECLLEIFEHHSFHNFGLEFETFFNCFSQINRELWTQLEQNKITHDTIRLQRFKMTLDQLGAESDLTQSEEYNQHFLDLLPNKKGLIENCVEVLDQLKNNYHLHILSNGYHEIQLKKLKNSGIDHYFGEIITNDRAGARKPDRAIFDFAITTAKAKKEDALMIGDSLDADIDGAEKAGMNAIHFDEYDRHKAKPGVPKIKQLTELLHYL
ncbi:YjjG family noncanonical pyrimidine nucleotidase [Jiulongibacter sediminis]|uniref:YjjG family noncanonical pyrimidine nucleotidase n=1 Tax=Jiulongibacter sediminis TaxID=1605367 RepID=UPI0006DCCA35|nr:YjjG family noncanonical pyrimidine nucleotidase [Jiulongibacter sediminis]